MHDATQTTRRLYSRLSRVGWVSRMLPIPILSTLGSPLYSYMTLFRLANTLTYLRKTVI